GAATASANAPRSTRPSRSTGTAWAGRAATACSTDECSIAEWTTVPARQPCTAACTASVPLAQNSTSSARTPNSSATAARAASSSWRARRPCVYSLPGSAQPSSCAASSACRAAGCSGAPAAASKYATRARYPRLGQVVCACWMPHLVRRQKQVVATGSGLRGKARRLVGLGALAVLTTVLLSGCSWDKVMSLGWPIDGITDRSRKMYDLWIGSVVAALIIGAIVWGLIFWCVIRYRKRGDELPAQTRYNLPLELLYTIVPFLIISVLFYYTAIVQTAVDKEPANPDVTVDVIAFKWNWEFSYRDSKGPDNKPVTTIGTSDYIPVLVLPTHKTMRVAQQ